MIGKFLFGGACFEYISLQDWALNTRHDDFNLELYMETRDRKYLPLHEGKTPTVFHLRPLTLVQCELIKGQPEHLRDRWRVALSVDRVDNYPTATGPLHVRHVGEGDERRLDVDTLKAMCTDDLVAELGLVVRRISGLDPLAGRR